MIFILQLNTEKCTAALWLSARVCRSRTITDADTKRHALECARALCRPREQTPPASRSIPLLSPTTHTRPDESRRQLTDFLFRLGEREAAQLTHGASFPLPDVAPSFYPFPLLLRGRERDPSCPLLLPSSTEDQHFQ